ncbi:UTP--glucose-1-phosphate uridylyltransferase [Nematocida sp. AWRm77]|nr:UTP--glucose-1-phosphate uridylyltransferase [Nematocida sp. AWRm77]
MDSNSQEEVAPSKVGSVSVEESVARIDSVHEFRKKGADNLVLLMREEIAAIKKKFHTKTEDVEKYLKLFSRYLNTRSEKLDWEKISAPPESLIVEYSTAHAPETEDIPGLLNRLAILKLNGGLGTSMGCMGPKSAIEVKDHLNFIDLSVRQIEYLNTTYGADVPIILMNSFNTKKQTEKLVNKHKNVWTFEQSMFPRVYADTLLPVLTDEVQGKDKDSLSVESTHEGWYPPGHGDVFESLQDSGMLDKLLSMGKDYLFISNIDNLKSTVDLSILNYVQKEGVDFLMEVTKKTRADVKGGTLISYEGNLRLLEIAQVPEYHKTDFTSIRQFKIFNTNSVWVNLHAVKELLQKNTMELEVIENKKKLSTGEDVIQLETALGASIRYFNNARGMVVPRERFLPVKTCSDLLLLQSSLFEIKHGTLAMSGRRIVDALPIVRLVGDSFKKIEDFQKRIKNSVNIDELDHLTISGDVTLGKNVTLKGNVIIVAEKEQSICIPDGAVLDDKIVTGSLSIVDH